MRSGHGRSVVLAVGLLVTAACTTVERTNQVSAGPGTGAPIAGSALDASGDGSASGADTGSAVGTGPGASSGPSAPGTPRRGGQTGAAADPAATDADAQAEGAAQPCPQDVPIKIGVSYSSDLAAGLAAVGQPDAAAQYGNYSEQVERIYQIPVDHLNQNGGIAGCEVQLVFFDFSSLASDGFDGQSQKECAHFAEDERVFAAVSAALETSVVVECQASHGVVSFFGGAEYAPVQRDFDRYRGYLYQPTQINPSRWGVFIDQFADGGFLAKGDKVGLLIADDGTGNAQHLANDVWAPKLEALGIDVVPFEYNWIRSFATVSDTSTAFSAAVLEFKTKGVTHVMSTPDGGSMSFFFTPQAESQNFRPAYRTAPNAGGTPNIAPEDQRADWVSVQSSFLGVSLNYPDDMNDEQQATNPPNESRQRCDAIYEGKIDGPNIAQGWCDTLWFLRDSLAGASEITPAMLLSGAEQLGTGLQLGAGFGASSFGPGRYDGNTQVRLAKYDPSQEDYVYVSPVLNVR